MPIKNLWSNLKRDYSKLGNHVKREVRKNTANRMKAEYEALTASMSIKFPFHVIERINESGESVFLVQVHPNATWERQNYDETVETWKLFMWLDKGIDISNAKFLKPNAEGKEILASKQFEYPDPYEPKNWTEQIMQKYERSLSNVVKSAIKSFLRGAS